MIREYKTIQEISGPLMVVDKVEGVTFDELAEIEMADGSVRRCKVLEVNGDKAMAILQEEASLNEIVRLVGADALAPAEQLTLATAKMIREDFLQQNSFVDIDSYSETERQYMLMAMILSFDVLSRAAIAQGVELGKILNIPVREKIGRAKTVPADEYKAAYAKLVEEMEDQITAIAEKGADVF